MARPTHHPALSLIAAAASFAAASSWAQSPSDKPAPAQLDPVTVTSRATPAASVSGWGDIPLAKTPLQASVFGSEQLKDAGVQRLSDITRIDPAISDAYNSEGYIDFLTVRGFVLDNRFNFRRDGLPINAETSIPLENKSRIEVLKGTSGMQAGTSAPGGLVNYVVKRPTDAPLRSASLEWKQPGTVIGAVDLSQRFGADQAFGVRLNAAAAHLDPMVRDSRGERGLFALAGDWRLSSDTLIEAEIESSHRSQPSQPGFSMLGDVVPSPGDPRINLNNQAWSLPVVFGAETASVRLQQKLANEWRLTLHAATQRLRNDDRLAYPSGVYDPATYECTLYCDRYAPDGTYTMWEFRSDNERRHSDAARVALDGHVDWLGLRHSVGLEILQSHFKSRFRQQTFDIAGTGNVAGTLQVPPSAGGTDENTNRTERSTEVALRDSVAITEHLSTWLGVRHTRIARQSVRTDGSEPTDYTGSFTTPWIAASYSFAADQMVYASWGRGVESTVTPNRDRYTNPGEVFTVESRQTEIGLKGSQGPIDWNLAAFDIRQPQTVDIGRCGNPGTCTTVIDGSVRHRGLEAGGGWHQGAWTVRGGAQWLHARREGSETAENNGLQPTNVPARTFKAQAGYDVPALTGLNLQAGLAYEGPRMVLPDNSARIPGYTRVDAGLRFDTQHGGSRWVWRLSVDNLFDKRAWRESPYEFSHVYLYPLAPRTLRFSVQVDV